MTTKPMLPCLRSSAAESAKRGKRGQRKPVKEKNGRSSQLNGGEDKWQQNFRQYISQGFLT